MKRNLTATVIYNPLAGPANMDETIEHVADFWRARDWDVDMRPTEYAGHAVALARQAAAEGRRLALAAGGDGTLGEVANGLAGSETIMGPLPTGTGNSFGKELRMPRPNLIDHHALVEAAELLAAGRVHRMDLGRFEKGKYWMLWTGTGVDSFVVEQIEPRSKMSKRLGPVGYVAQALSVVPGFPPMEAVVEVDGECYEGVFLLVVVSNCRRFAGGEVLLNPEAVLDDGQFEVFMFRGHGVSRTFHYLWEVWRGQHVENPDIVVARGSHVSVSTAEEMPVHTDGDPAGHTPFVCHVAPGALRLLVPRTAPPRLFSGPGLPLVS
ncbi:MAG TPA: diacylglycerol kinase family protein [Candidatus Sulfomarinibacteraceae bacterium]|nr:diacylglycerol kinase family protein [Candidatus Sulfomarinibacteraceae bacterium]